MQIHQLSREQCAEIVGRTSLGRLACAKDDQPYVVPIHYSYDADDRCLYTCSSEGQKVAWMRGNPKVCVEVDDIADKRHWTTVVIFGRYQEIGSSDADAALRERAWRLLQQRAEWWLPAAAKMGAHEPHAMVVYRITIDRVTGRRASRVE